MAARPIYLDNHATTRPDPRVLEAMWPWFADHFGNASSVSHAYGWEASDALDDARARVAEAIGAEAREVVFTSGATEANNLAIKGVLPALRARGNHLVTAASEHKSVLDVLKSLRRSGWDVTVIRPDRYGQVGPDAVEAALTDRTVLVSVMAANNEVGTLNPVDAIGRLCRERGVVFHCDATQAVGRVPLDVNAIPADLLSLSGHKIYGPKGIGALYVRATGGRPVRLTPLFEGGGQERGLRAGTVAVPLAVGFGMACELAVAERESVGERVRTLRDRLHERISGRLDGVTLNGHPTERLPGNLNLSFTGVEGEALMMAMTRVAVSSGSACTSNRPEPSHVLLAMGVDESLARASLRFGLGRETTEEEVDLAADVVVEAVRRLRAAGGTLPLGSLEPLAVPASGN
ncbi:MAG: cysteine desulfurase family protein [Isosphaeraceae bacterium]